MSRYLTLELKYKEEKPLTMTKKGWGAVWVTVLFTFTTAMIPELAYF